MTTHNIENIITTTVISSMKIPVTTIKSFIVTGITIDNKRFVKRYSCGENNRTAFETAMMINLYRGSVWAEFENGTRKLLKRVYN